MDVTWKQVPECNRCPTEAGSTLQAKQLFSKWMHSVLTRTWKAVESPHFIGVAAEAWQEVAHPRSHHK